MRWACTSPPGWPRPSTGPSRSATLGTATLEAEAVQATLGTVLKYREDQERIGHLGLESLIREASERAG